MTEKYEYCSTIPRTFIQDCTYEPFFEAKLQDIRRDLILSLHLLPVLKFSIIFEISPKKVGVRHDTQTLDTKHRKAR